VATAGVVGATSVDFLQLGVLVVVMTLIMWAAAAWYARLPACPPSCGARLPNHRPSVPAPGVAADFEGGEPATASPATD